MTESDRRSGARRPSTLHDVAERVGVSARTVSRVVNDEGGFSETTRRRVLDAVADLAYRPNVHARQLISGRSGSIGFLAPTLSDPFFPELAEGVQRAARAAGLMVLLSVSNGDGATQTDVLTELGVRVAVQGLWPERLRPSVFIVIAPPAVVGLGLLQFGAPPMLVWACWGAALFALLWAGTQLRAIAALPFALPHWAMSFPLAAFAALSLRLATPGTPFALLALALLALASLLIAALLLATWRGLRDGSLLAPEPVAMLQPVAAAG